MRRKPKDISDSLQVLASKSARYRDISDPANVTFIMDRANNYTLFERIYLSTWIGKKVIKIPTEYAFKNGFTFKIEGYPEIEEAVLELYRERELEDLLKEAQQDADIYGGSVILMKCPNADPNKPFDPAYAAINPDGVEFIEYDSSYIVVTPHINPGSRLFNKPARIGMYGFTAEASHCLVFKGVDVPTRWKPNFKYIGMSIFQNIMQTLINDEILSKTIPNLVWRSSIYFYKLDGFTELVKNDEEDKVISRVKAFEDLKSNFNAGVIDKEDEVQVITQTFAGLPELDQRSVSRLSAATGIPATVLLGKSPDGQNSTGDSDLENFYNYIEDYQMRITPNMKRLFETLIYMVAGQPLDFTFEFNKPQQISEMKQLDIDQKTIANAQLMQGMGIPSTIINRYLSDKGVITTDEVSEIEGAGDEMLALTADPDEGEPVPTIILTDSLKNRVKRWFKNG